MFDQQLGAPLLQIQVFLFQRRDLLAQIRAAGEGEAHELRHVAAQRPVDLPDLRNTRVDPDETPLLLIPVFLPLLLQTLSRSGKQLAIIGHALPTPYMFSKNFSSSPRSTGVADVPPGVVFLEPGYVLSFASTAFRSCSPASCQLRRIAFI